MTLRKTLTISLSQKNFQFLENESKIDECPKSSLVERALDYYRRFTLKKKLISSRRILRF